MTEIPFLDSYASLAGFITGDVDSSTKIYNRFNWLGTRNILYLQSELAHLESRLRELDARDDMNEKFEQRRTGCDWGACLDAANKGEDWAKEKVALIKQIRATMKEYREALTLDSAMTQLLPPSKNTHAAFQTRYHNLEHGSRMPALQGPNSTLYDTRASLLSLTRPPEEDRLTRFLRRHARLLFLQHPPSLAPTNTTATTKLSRITQINGSRITTVVTILNVLLAAAFLFGAIYNLYFVQRDQTKLGLIALYTSAFAGCIALVSNAKRSEIFGACAAYAAVLVVFVSGDLAGGGSNGGDAG